MNKKIEVFEEYFDRHQASRKTRWLHSGILVFTKEFNAKTADQAGLIIPVVITIYQDRSFTFILKTPPVPVLIKQACKLESGSARPNRDKVAKLTKAQAEEIAKLKLPDLNTTSLESAISMVRGTARSMGVTVEE